jgi:hypothetical protein
MNATFLRQFTFENPPTKQLFRRPVIQNLYDQFSKTKGPETFIQGLKSRLETEKYILIENMFPYDLQPPIQHSCIWYNGELTKQEVEAIIKEKEIDYITFFENPTDLKSVKEIKHYHLFHY